ncbi:hypothetical protein KC340_g6383 [Hortaea werneckii]|nr:hypothetical protein KC342_g4586 [Hortaea werneckii]KAI7102294.1 hypothetical protein KC339_g6095 [Hortaea werneckii]KAI7243407.1 hypothetical protein KC365_g2297 [Hortaea werneckii]KAI7324431.1 hypothetical protein KC340_g6383 [Hortaea werneckii]KAI7381876.1 hypothetical protein KC328_g11998 [Hortaea werneckii]
MKEAYCRMPAQAVPKRAGEGTSPSTSLEKRVCLSHDASGFSHTEVDTAPTTARFGVWVDEGDAPSIKSPDEVAPGLRPEIESWVETWRNNAIGTNTLKGKSLDEARALPSKNCVAQRSKGARSDEFCLAGILPSANKICRSLDGDEEEEGKSRLSKVGKATTAKAAAIAKEVDILNTALAHAAEKGRVEDVSHLTQELNGWLKHQVDVGERTALAALRQENAAQGEVAEQELSQLRDKGREKDTRIREREAATTSQEDTTLRLRNDNRDQNVALEEAKARLSLNDQSGRGHVREHVISATDSRGYSTHGDVVSPDVLNQALNTLEGSQAAREGAHGDQTESAVVPSWFRQLTIQNVQGMLDQAAASYMTDEDNIIFRILGRRGRWTVLKPHQRIYMDWALAMEIKYGSAVNGDGCGLGKTIMLDRHEAFTAGPRSIVIMTLQELSNISHEDVPHLGRLFGRVCVDESQGFRHALITKKGAALISFCARFRHCFTATICYDSLHDINGHLAFLERREWTEDRDWNAYKHGNPQFGENVLYTAARRVLSPKYSYRPDAEVDVDMDNMSEDSNGPDYEDVCRSIAVHESTYDPDRYIAELAQHRGRCQSFSYLLVLNSREESVEARFRQNEEGRRYSEDSPPFPFNPFDTFSALNRNIVQCATVRAFSYYIAPFIDRALKDPRAKEDISVAADRVKKIFDLLVLARRYSTTVVDRNGNTVRCGDGIPPATTAMVDLRFSEEEQAEYRRREQDARCRLKWQELIRDLYLEITTRNLDDVDLSASARPKTPPKFATRRGRAIAHGRKYAFMTTLSSQPSRGSRWLGSGAGAIGASPSLCSS